LFAAALPASALLLLGPSCDREESDAQPREQSVNIAVSILPQRYFVESIGGERIGEIHVLVEPGHSPATYELTAEDMRSIAATDLLFTVGVPFEQTWIPRIESANPGLRVVETHSGLERLPIDRRAQSHENEDPDGDHHHQEGAPDPHIWLSPALVQHQAEAIAEALSEFDPEGSDYYRANLVLFEEQLDSLSEQISVILEPVSGAAFMVYHPSWGYFADEFGLVQVPVEAGGDEPSPSEIADLLELAEQLEIRAIFVQPQFSTRAAELIATELDARVAVLDPLAGDWAENLLRAAEELRGHLE
jgi:zinc transport system substrate-binding protein